VKQEENRIKILNVKYNKELIYDQTKYATGQSRLLKDKDMQSKGSKGSVFDSSARESLPGGLASPRDDFKDMLNVP